MRKYEWKQPLVTIIMPVYNVQEYLDEAIQSIICQDYDNKKLIIVDDGSTDDSANICDKYIDEYGFISVFHKENGGLSSARNVGLTQTSEKSKYLLFFDSDDVLLKSSIRLLVETAENTQADIVIPDRYYKFTGNIQCGKIVRHFPKFMYSNDCKKFASDVLIEQGRAWRAHSLLYKYEIIKKNNLSFREDIMVGEDFFFNLDYLKKATTLEIIDQPTVYYRIRKNSLSHSLDTNYEIIIWLMDEYVQKFYHEIENTASDRKRYSLLKRNAVFYFTSLISKNENKNIVDYEKIAKEFLNDPRVHQAFLVRTKIPFYNNKLAQIYFGIQYFFLKYGKIDLATNLAKLKTIV